MEEQEQNPISEAKEVLTKLEEQNNKFKENLDRAERLKVEDLVSGKSLAGQPEKTEEQKEIESAKKLLAGTGFDEELFPDNRK